ncbi:hypothetical protein [Azohydromonas caseinilytica]|uniref:DUF4175 domain-containing protein n=1 Tax=Azohydromonas caseinilytica TaxID=2728836 RepID=A0A848FBQ0_9BURK|nr:hypothetical protein [Azohydromonas caseinilytica]NML16336.1 DUF4175 domain-containing protein [Azohydromonas caseinilytica]
MCATTTESGRSHLDFLSRWRRRRAGVLFAAALLAGCGGGVYIGIGPDDDPPTVSLVVAPTVAQPGQTLTLLADARDDYGVDYVAFYQLLPNGGAVRLGIVPAPPYQLTVVLPADAQDPTQFFARAVDGANQYGDSATAVVRVLR